VRFHWCSRRATSFVNALIWTSSPSGSAEAKDCQS
jgi:hypothetical protein